MSEAHDDASFCSSKSTKAVPSAKVMTVVETDSVREFEVLGSKTLNSPSLAESVYWREPAWVPLMVM